MTEESGLPLRDTGSDPAASKPGEYKFRHFPQLDGFRGLAIVLVILGHVVKYSGRGKAYYDLGQHFAATGVFLFFVLSGFLITGLLQKERASKGTVDLKRFYLRRALRLGPALLLFLSVVTILKLLGFMPDLRAYEIAACLLYARNFFGKSLELSHIWSLSLEEQFYLCWPGVYKLTREKRALSVAIGITLAMAIWRGFAIQLNLFHYESGIYYMRPYFRFDSILIGACLALGLAGSPQFVRTATVYLKAVPAYALWSLLALWTYFGQDISRPLYLTLQMILITAILGQLILVEKPISQALFKNRLLQYLGRISYSLYLWQQIFLVVETPSRGLLRQFPINVAVSLGLAMLSFHFVEAPALRLKDRLG